MTMANPEGYKRMHPLHKEVDFLPQKLGIAS